MIRIMLICGFSLVGLLATAAEESTAPTKFEPVIFTGEVIPEAIPYPKLRQISSGLRQSFQLAEATFEQTGGFSVDISDRQHSRVFFNTIFGTSAGTADGFTGDVDNCIPGVTSALFKEAVLLRVNYFREMAGVPDGVTFDTTKNAKSQEAALIMSANEDLSHEPPETWDCWTQDGDEAAGASNLSLGNYGWDAVFSQMRDNGTNNSAAGHRRWIVFPPTEVMGTGDIPASNNFPPSNSLWVLDLPNISNDVPIRDSDAVNGLPFVAWPPPGFVPYQIAFPRWSFAIPNASVGANADFSSATVTMTQGGDVIATDIEPLSSGIGDNTLVWVADGLDPSNSTAAWPKPNADTTYQVSINNVLVDGGTHDFSYEVTLFDPSTQGAGEVEAEITGPANATVGTATAYTFSTVSFAEDYALRTATSSDFSGTEGAESGTATITDGTSAAYSVVSETVSATGNASFRLAHPAPPIDQYFVMERLLLVSSSSVLSFKSRLGVATSDQIAKAQVSLDDGQSWIDVYTQAGSGQPGETTFTDRSVPLSDYAGRAILVRFAYEFDSGSYFPQTIDGVGFYVDDITVTNAQELTDTTTSTLGDVSSFDFTPPAYGDYVMQVQYFGWPGFPGSDWGPAFTVTASDNDGVDDAIDNCPNDANANQLDTDGDGDGDVCDDDDDDDGVLDGNDAFPLDDSESVDTDGDGIGNNADLDDDNDGVSDVDEIQAGRNPLINEARVIILLLNILLGDD